MKRFFLKIFVFCIFLLPFNSMATEHWRAHAYDVQHYRIDINIDIPNETVNGTTSLIIKSLQNNLDTLRLDAEDMEFLNVSVDRKELKDFLKQKKEIIIPLSQKYKKGDVFTVGITYIAKPEKGLYFFYPDEKEPDLPVQAWSQGEGMDNHHWFPCYDYPNDKATMELITKVQKGFTAISNGNLVSKREEKDGTVFHYRFDQQTPAYLISIIVGKYVKFQDTYKDIPVQYFVYPRYSETDVMRSFGRTTDMLAFFSDYTGFEYPYNKYTQTLITDFMYSGMENISATTLTDRTMHDERAHLNFSSDGLVAHELAHQWFGDLVTCREWGEMWLNEGFATFFTDLYMEKFLGRIEYDYRIWRKQQAVIRAELKKPRTLTGPENWGVYIKGASVLHMLRHYLGEDNFRAGIKSYLHHYAFANAESHDLRKSLEDESGVNLYTFFDQWVFGKGIPQFTVSSQYKGAVDSLYVLVKQTQDTGAVRKVFEVDVSLGIVSGDAYNELPMHINKRTQNFAFAMDENPEMIIFDAGQTLLKKVAFDKSAEQLAADLPMAKHLGDKLFTMDQLLKKIKEAEQATAAAAFIKQYEDTDNDILRGEAISHLAKLENLSAPKQHKIASTLADWLEDEESARAREKIISAMSTFPVENASTILENSFKNDESYQCQARALGALIALDTTKADKYFKMGIEMDSWDETIRSTALRNLHYLPQEQILLYAGKYAFAGNKTKLRSRAVGNLIDLLQTGNDEAREMLFDLIRENRESNRYRPVFRAIIALAKDKASKDELEPLLEGLAKQRLNRYVRYAIEQTFKKWEQSK